MCCDSVCGFNRKIKSLTPRLGVWTDDGSRLRDMSADERVGKVNHSVQSIALWSTRHVTKSWNAVEIIHRFEVTSA